MARYLPSEQCRVSRPQFPQSTHGTPGTMTPLLARKTVAFYDSGFPTEARVIIICWTTWKMQCSSLDLSVKLETLNFEQRCQ